MPPQTFEALPPWAQIMVVVEIISLPWVIGAVLVFMCRTVRFQPGPIIPEAVILLLDAEWKRRRFQGSVLVVGGYRSAQIGTTRLTIEEVCARLGFAEVVMDEQAVADGRSFDALLDISPRAGSTLPVAERLVRGGRVLHIVPAAPSPPLVAAERWYRSQHWRVEAGAITHASYCIATRP